MKFIPSLPANAPFSPEQRAWVNGFLAGVCNELQAESTPLAAKTQKPILVLFGSQTGSAERLAKRFAKRAPEKGFVAHVHPLNDAAKIDWSNTDRAVVITSTWGDGDPPDNATEGWAWLRSESAPRLENLAYAVLGLGDKNYVDFCGASKKFDLRLEALGARRLVLRGECDIDFEGPANQWIDSLWTALETGVANKASNSSARSISDPPGLASSESRADPETSALAVRSRKNPFGATLKTNLRLNKVGSAKDTRHFEIALDAPTAPSYEVGDALGIWPTNCPVLVEELLATLGFKGDEAVTQTPGGELSLHEALLRHYVITQPSLEFVTGCAERSEDPELSTLLKPERRSDRDAWLYGRDLVDVLRASPTARWTPNDFIRSLRPLGPRLYSISSSLKAHPGEVHLTVACVRYQTHGRSKKGVASCWLADRIQESPLPVYVQTSHGFCPPTDPQRPMIMVGPGTGIAPFRAFLEERRATGATGAHWLFFGDQQRATDFLYEDQITSWHQDGLLARLDLAFSRDQSEKIYVQNRMRENAVELWRWLENGAHFYVCGDAKRMAKDVDAVLREVIERAGGKSRDQADEYVDLLRSEKRYQRDVY